MVNASLLDEFGGMSLEACCRFMQVTPKKGDGLYAHLAKMFGGEATRDQMANFHRLSGDDPMAVEYATGDGDSTWSLWVEQQKALDLEDLRRVWKVECDLIPVLHRMMMRGIKIDESRLTQVAELVTTRHKAAIKAAKLPADFNEKAPTQMIKLFTTAGHTDWPMTPPSRKFPKGQPSFPKPWLLTNPLGQKIVIAREYRHLKNSFLTPLIERHLYKGRVHTNYNQTRGEVFGVVTGRLSSNDPNLQQIHKRNEILGRLMRSIFVPDKGMLWGEPDYSQIEPRLLAHYSDCKVLIDGYRASPVVDAHGAVAAAIWGDSYTKDQRQKGKTVNQTLISGGGINKITAELGLSLGEGRKLMNDYFSKMPEIKDIQKESMAIFRQRRFIRSLLGRKARLEDSRFAYRAINRLLQCGNADIIKEAMVDVDAYLRSEGDETHLLNNCHDALSLQFPKKKPKQYQEALRLMAAQGVKHNLLVPLETETNEGDNWATATWGPEKQEKAA